MSVIDERAAELEATPIFAALREEFGLAQLPEEPEEDTAED